MEFLDYSKKACFHLPSNFISFRIYDGLIYLMENYPEFFFNVRIGSIYGSPKCIWNGGRTASFLCSDKDLENDEYFFKEKNIPLRFTFTNLLIKNKNQLNDCYGNKILEIFKNGNNEIICNSLELENYIVSKYGSKYKYISSTTKCIKDSKKIQEEISNNRYKLIVLDYNYNNDFNFVKKLENKEKIEILVNPVCNKNCPIRLKHYIDISECQLGIKEKSDFSNCECQHKLFFEVKKSQSFVSKKNILKYQELGINNFKIEGRTALLFDLIEILTYYLVKPKYYLEFREMIHHICYE